MNINTSLASVTNENGSMLISSLEIVNKTGARMRGLLGRDGLDNGCGILITPCASIHTYFMRFNIDVVFLDRDYKVLRVASNVPPWQILFAPPKTRSVLEFASDWLEENSIHSGDQLKIISPT